MASEITITEIPQDRIDFLDEFGIQPKFIADAFHGIHGYIISASEHVNLRLGKNDLRKMMESDIFRWVEVIDGHYTFGL